MSGTIWFFLALLLLVIRVRTISSTLHLRRVLRGHFLLLMLPAHLLLMMLRIHLLLMMQHLLIHRVWSVSSVSGAGRLGCVHLRLVAGHVLPVPLISGLVSIGSSFLSVTSSGASGLPIMRSHISAVIFSFSGSGSRTRTLKVTFIYVPRFVASSRTCPCS